MGVSTNGTIFMEKKLKFLGPIKIDILSSESHEMSSQVPQLPVETGESVSDHVINEPRRCSLSCMVTNTPVIPGLVSVALPKMKTVFELLKWLHSRRETISVVTGLEVYSSMIINSISVPRNKTTGEAIVFDVSLVEIKTVSSNTVDVNPDSIGEPQAEPVADMGTSAPVRSVPAAESPWEKMLRQMREAATV